VFASLQDALASCSADEEVYVIGGASIYRQAMKTADRLCLTEVDDEAKEADAWFPAYKEEWVETTRENHQRDDRHAFSYAFVDYVRKA